MKLKGVFVLSSVLLFGWTFWMFCQHDSNRHSATVNKKPVCRTLPMEKLNQVYLLVEKAYKQKTPPTLAIVTQLLDVIQSVNSDTVFVATEPNIRSESQLLDVCPEEWVRPIDYPFYQKGFIMSNCSNVRPLSEVISLVVNFDSISDCETNLPNIISGLDKFYPSIGIYIPGNIFPNCSAAKSNNKITYVPMESSWKSGKIWNELIAAVSTPYVLIGRDLNYFDTFTQIERQIRMISYTSDIVIAGGSKRNLSGHWKVGCYQSKLQNYILEHQEGYYRSRNECMFCDHLLGSFVTTKTLLQKIPFDTNLPSFLIFDDFFLKVKSSHLGFVVSCPDVMYFSTTSYEDRKVKERELWLPLAKKWELNRIFLPGDIKHTYSCQDIGINNCRKHISQDKWFLLPLCCLEQFARMVKFFHDFCVKNNVVYEFEAGSALGGVKLRGMMPWDIDGDCTFYNDNYSLFLNSKHLFRQKGIVLNDFGAPNEKGRRDGYFKMNSPDIYFDMWGYPFHSKDLYLPSIFQGIPTKMLFNNIWVYTQASPGLYARNRYGKEILKHSNSWLHLGMKNSWQNYTPGQFLPCPKPEHHACESHFSADGSLQFYIP